MERILSVLGVPEKEERVYRTLLKDPRTSLARLAGNAGLPAGQVRTALAALEEKGLVSRLPGRSQRYLPAPPDLAVDGLIHRRQAELQQVRVLMTRLLEEFKEGTAQAESPRELIELVRGREAVNARAVQLQHGAHEEIVTLSTPPYAATSMANPDEGQLLEEGVAYRNIYSREALEVPGVLESIEHDVERGEQARVLDSLPMKLLIADRRLGLVPLTSGEAFIEGAILIHPSTLLDALFVLFDILWDRAFPLPLDPRATSAPDDEPLLSREDERLLSLLLSGAKDAAIARQLGVAPRTLRRRIGKVEDALGAVSRFQAGYQAARLGLGASKE